MLIRKRRFYPDAEYYTAVTYASLVKYWIYNRFFIAKLAVRFGERVAMSGIESTGYSLH